MVQILQKIKHLEQVEKQLLAEEKRIQEAEERIRLEEERILDSERLIVKAIKDKPLTSIITISGSKKRLEFVRMRVLRKIAKHKLLFAIIVTVTFVLIWRGTWGVIDELPILSIPIVSLLVGVLLVWLLRKYSELEDHG